MRSKLFERGKESVNTIPPCIRRTGTIRISGGQKFYTEQYLTMVVMLMDFISQLSYITGVLFMCP